MPKRKTTFFSLNLNYLSKLLKGITPIIIMELTEEQLMRRRAADKKYKDANKEKERLRHKKYND